MEWPLFSIDAAYVLLLRYEIGLGFKCVHSEYSKKTKIHPRGLSFASGYSRGHLRT